MSTATILIADDDPADRLLTRRAFEITHTESTLQFVRDGEELLDYLRCQGQFSDEDRAPKPDLVLLDLNMPRMDGREALAAIRADPDLCHIPVVVLTTSRAS